MKRNHSFIALLALSAWLHGLVLSQSLLLAAEVAPRLAVVPRDPALREMADLLSVTLSGHSGLALLERAEIDRIQREQTLANSTGTGSDVRIGQLLGADGLLTLDFARENGRTQLQARVIAVKPGVILRSTSYPWPLNNAADWPPAVSAQLVPLIPKLGVLARDATPISVVNLRSAIQSPEAARLEKEMTLLLIHRLARQPEIFVLERQRLDDLASEKELKGMDPAPFWKGSYLLEGVVDRDGYAPDRVTVHARLTGPPGTTPLVVESSGPRRDPMVAIDILVQKILSVLGRPSQLAAWEAKAEAARFFEEGNWALRWQAHDQARWAAESAWALGDHSLRAARLRVLAWCMPWGTPPGQPDFNEGTLQFYYDRVYPEALAPVATALEHFVAATPRIEPGDLTNDWPTVGLTALGYAAHHLSRYWWTPHAADEAGEGLERLREAARQAQRMLLAGEERPGPATYATVTGRKIWELKMTAGWLWERSPADVLAEYARLLDGNLGDTQRHQFIFRDVRRPSLPAWSPAERAAAPGQWGEFLQERVASTNPSVSIVAHLLRLQYTPAAQLVEEPRGSYTRAARPVFDTLVRNGPGLLCASPELFRDALQVLQRRQRYLWEPPVGMPITNAARDFRTNFMHQWAAHGSCFDSSVAPAIFRTSDFEPDHLRVVLNILRERTGTGEGQMPRWKQNFFRAHLGSFDERITDTQTMLVKGLYRPEVFTALFDPEDYGLEDGTELLRALNSFRNNMRVPGDPMASSVAALEKRLAGLNAPSRSTSVIVRPASASAHGTLTATQWWQAPSPLPDPRLTTDLGLIEARYREGHLWLEARLGLRTNSNLNLSPESRSVIYKIDLKTMKSRYSMFSPAIPTLSNQPRFWASLPRTFEVLGSHVYVSWRDQLLTTPVELGDWTPVQVPVAAQSRLFGIGRRLYLAAPDRLLEYDPASKETRVMASTRRRPPETELDSLPNFASPGFLKGNTDGSIVHVLLGNTVHPWNVASGTWGASIRLADRGTPEVMDMVEDGAVLRSQAMGMATRKMFRLSPGRAVELIIHEAPKVPGMMAERPRSPMKPAGLWSVPDQIDPLAMPLALEPGRVWMLNRRFVTGPQQEPGLVIYDDRWPDPVVLRLLFNRANPFPVNEAQMMGARPQLVATPDGLVLTGRLWNGFWFIPRADLETAIAQAREKMAK